MIAIFYATRLIDELTTYNRVPRIIQDTVDAILIERGYEHLIGGGDK